MSRIYDALRKAEEEKQSQPVEQPVPRSAMEAAAQDAAETAEKAAAPVVAPLVAPDTRQTYQPVAEAAHSVTSARTTKWNPDVSTLPALSSVSGDADEFRRIRSRLYQYRDSQPLRSILIASGLPSEGKSFVAANLAICLAQSEGKVLLIDGDLRKPSLHTMLGSPSAPGLSDYLAGNASPSQIVQQGNVPNLSLIAGGTPSPNAAELSGNRYMEQLIASFSGDYEWIIVDSAPVIAVPDAVALARACDGVLIVARSANTPFDVAQRTVKEFAGSRIVGFVLNAVPDKKARPEYSGYGSALLGSGDDSSIRARAAGAD